MVKQSIQTKAEEILQEIRVVLPGTQALLGFQFIVFFNPIFQGLPRELQYLHFATLLLTMMSTILLLAPVAFQQIGEKGETTPTFVSFARKMVNAAMWILLVAFAGDVFIAAKVIQASDLLAAASSGLVLLAGTLLWYVYGVLKNS